MSRPWRVLVVDDDPVMRRLMALMFMRRDPEWVISVSGSGNEALAAVALERPDLVLVDLMMPGMDGLELTDRLKILGVPIIMITGHVEEEWRERALAAGCVAVLHKPIDVPGFMALLLEFLPREPRE